MVKVFYRGYPHSKINAWLGGRLFVAGVTEFDNTEEAIYFADMFRLKYEVVEVEPKKAKTKKKVKEND